VQERIDSSGYPLGFLVKNGERLGVLGEHDGSSVFVTEARMLGGHQKEVIVEEGAGGAKWRVTSDEGIHLKGDDLAPFPLGFFNAGLQGDLYGRLVRAAAEDGYDLGKADVKLMMQNYYWFTGSFVRGDGKGFSDPPNIQFSCQPGEQDTVAALVERAISMSPAIAALRKTMENTFALYVNGIRQPVTSMKPSNSEDAPDPYITYGKPPAPADNTPADPIWKTGQIEDGEIKTAPAGTKTKIIRTVTGSGKLVDPKGVVETDTWLEMPGVTHFGIRADESLEGLQAPSGLSLISAGIAFCFMTQLSRYIENMKLGIEGMRLVQYTPFSSSAKSGGTADIGVVDTHLFLNGRTDVETHENLMRISAETCFLHATLAKALDPVVSVNGQVIE